MPVYHKVTIGAVQACVDDVEYALRLMQKAAVARQARVSVQTPEGLRSFLRAGGGDSQSSGTVSEARFLLGCSPSELVVSFFWRKADSLAVPVAGCQRLQMCCSMLVQECAGTC